jgi:fibrillarin-like pre-rRNA processing protein
VAVKNAPFVRDGGHVYVVVKARSEDVTAEPEEKYEEVAERMEEAYEVDRIVELSPFYDDHAVVVARR